MADQRAAVERHMRAFRAHGEIGGVVVQAQFLALQVVMASEFAARASTPPDVLEDLRLFVAEALARLDEISPGYASLMSNLLPTPWPRRGRR